MELDIRFCSTSLGESIAYATLGKGQPLVIPPGWVSHLELELAEPGRRSEFLERLARHHTVVLYDRYGCGLSDRNRTDFTWEADLRALHAVIDGLKLEQFALLGVSAGGPITIMYASAFPERVSHLLLYGTYARLDAQEIALRDALIALVRAEWGLGSKALAERFIPGADTGDLQWFSEFQRQAASAEMAAELYGMGRQLDLVDLLPTIRTSTLVVHRQQDRAVPFRLGRQLASSIPNARLVPMQGDVHFFHEGDSDALIRTFETFLGTAGSDPRLSHDAGESPQEALISAIEIERTDLRPHAAPDGTVTILFTDIEGSTPMTERLGDRRAQEVLRTHNTTIRQEIAAHEGFEVKSQGDGFMVAFSSARRALECAIAIQRNMAVQQSKESVRVRIGLHTGEAIKEGEDFFGKSVILAARIADQAGGEQILVSSLLKALVESGGEFEFGEAQEVELKGLSGAHEMFEVQWREHVADSSQVPLS